MFLTAFCTLGIRKLANALADPFGSDDTDIPVLDYVSGLHHTCDQLMTTWTVPKSQRALEA